MITFFRMHTAATMDHVGVLPSFFDLDDPRPAREQIDERYAHGGGWRPDPKSKFVLREDFSLKYPGDRPMPPMAAAPFRGELILVYESAWVAIVQGDGSFEVSRCD